MYPFQMPSNVGLLGYRRVIIKLDSICARTRKAVGVYPAQSDGSGGYYTDFLSLVELTGSPRTGDSRGHTTTGRMSDINSCPLMWLLALSR